MLSGAAPQWAQRFCCPSGHAGTVGADASVGEWSPPAGGPGTPAGVGVPACGAAAGVGGPPCGAAAEAAVRPEDEGSSVGDSSSRADDSAVGGPPVAAGSWPRGSPAALGGAVAASAAPFSSPL